MKDLGLTSNQITGIMLSLIFVNMMLANHYAIITAAFLFWLVMIIDVIYMIRRHRYIDAQYKESKRLFDAGKIEESWDVLMNIGKYINGKN
jgi:uncharacterized membrane protein